MQIPAALRRRPPAAVLTETRAALAAATAKRAELKEQRRALIEGDTTASTLQIDRAINDAECEIFSLTEREKDFEQRTADREAEKRKEQYDKDVAALNGRILALIALEGEIADWMDAGRLKLEQLAIGQRSVLRDWPSERVPLPFASQIGLDRAEQALAEGFAPFDRQKFGRWPDWDWARKLNHIKETAADFKTASAHNYDDLVTGLRAGSPKLPEPGDSEAAA